MTNRVKVFIGLFLLFSFLIVGCGSESAGEEAIEKFGFLERGMSYDEIVARVGPPDEDIGSGIYIFVYSLENGDIVSMSFLQLDSLGAASISDKNGNIIAVLVEPEP